MKVLHLVKTSSGAEWAYRLMRDLVKCGVEVHVAMPVDGKLVPLYMSSGIHVHKLKYNITRPLATMSHIKRLVNELKPNVIHSHFVLTTLLMRLSLRNIKIPRVFEVPGPLHLEHALYRNLDILTAQKDIDYWIPTCLWSYDRYVKCGVDSKRLFMTYYGGDLVDKKYEKGILRHELGLQEKDIVVGMVAYMYAPKKFLGQKRGLKGHEDLIDAISLIQDKYPNLHLVIIGGPWVGAAKYADNVIAYGKSKVRNIHFLGTRDNVPNLYQDIDLVVHPSHSENLGGAAESLLLGIPTIATNVGGFPDIVIPGKTGYLVPTKNPEELAKTIESVMADYSTAKDLAENGSILLKELLDSRKTSSDVYNFYKHILG